MKYVSVPLIALFLASIFSPFVFAQSESGPSISIKVPPSLSFGRESTVVIEINDADGQPMGNSAPTVSFSPAGGVSDDYLFDCSNIDESESCDANDRGIAGVFESVFTLEQSPVTLTVELDGVEKQAQLVVSQGEGNVATASQAVPQAKASETPSLSPSAVKVGPSPSIWFILLPMVLIMAVVTVFVVGTTE